MSSLRDLQAQFEGVSKVIAPWSQFGVKAAKQGWVGHGTTQEAARGIARNGVKPSSGAVRQGGKAAHPAGPGVYTVPMGEHNAAQTVGAYAGGKGGKGVKGRRLGKKTGAAMFYKPSGRPTGTFGNLEEAYDPKTLGKPVHRQNVHHDSVDRMNRGNEAFADWKKAQRQASTPLSDVSPYKRRARLKELRKKRGVQSVDVPKVPVRERPGAFV